MSRARVSRRRSPAASSLRKAADGLRRRRIGPSALLGVVLAALLLTGLRMDLIRVRYDLGTALNDEKALREEHRALSARRSELRDPRRLTEWAGKLDLQRPERVLELPAAQPSRP